MAKGLLVVTAVGSDRVGIVEGLSALIVGHRCNIEESRMTVLGGEFALIALISGDSASIPGLETALATHARSMGLELSTRRTDEPELKKSGLTYRVVAVSLDTPGIVHRVTELLRDLGVNIIDLETETTGAPFTGAPMFRLRADIVLPTDLHFAALRREITQLAERDDLDIELKALKVE